MSEALNVANNNLPCTINDILYMQNLRSNACAHAPKESVVLRSLREADKTLNPYKHAKQEVRPASKRMTQQEATTWHRYNQISL